MSAVIASTVQYLERSLLLLTVIRLYWLLLFSLFRYRYLGDGGTDWRETLHDGTYRSR